MENISIDLIAGLFIWFLILLIAIWLVVKIIVSIINTIKSIFK